MINFFNASVKMENHTMEKDICDILHDGTVLRMILLSAFICVVCICGLVGNGTVIWLLGFRIKRNPFNTYILNLAIADFGVLIASISIAVIIIVHIQIQGNMNNLFIFYGVSGCLFFFFYSISQFLLTAISIDRCVSVLFPLWYRCRRPTNLSTVFCAVIWFVTFMFDGLCIGCMPTTFILLLQFFVISVNTVICLPLITVSTLILSFKFCFKTQQQHRGKLLMAILLTLFFFLIFQMNILFLIAGIFSHYILQCYKILEYGLLCACLNSFVNPLLYFLVGRKKKGLCRENLKHILQRVFTEEKEAILTCPPGSNTGDATGMTTTKQMKKNSTEEPGTQLSDLQKPLP